MKIIISEKNREKIEAELEQIQKRCRVRTIEYQDIEYWTLIVEMELGISKKSLTGTTGFFNPHGSRFPNAYNGVPESTLFTAYYDGKQWVLSSLARVDARRRGRVDLELSETAKAAVLVKVSKWQ